MEPALQELFAEGLPDDEVAVIIRLSAQSDIPSGVRVITRFGPIATCRIRRGDIPAIRHQASVRSMKVPRIYTPTPVDVELGTPHFQQEGYLNEIRLSDIRRSENIHPTGKGVIVAHIDWGVDFTHPDFRNKDGTTRLLAIWDQSAFYDPLHPNKYGYGRIYHAPEINDALEKVNPADHLGYDPAISDRGAGSHGTHTLSISAGNGASGGPVGLAPEAHLLFVDLSTSSNGLACSPTLQEGLDFCGNIADQLQMPLVVNLSLGRQAGQHDGKTLSEQAMDFFVMEKPGRVIVQSAGNYFNRRIHSSGLLRPGKSRAIHFIVEAGDKTPNEIDLWYPGADRLKVKISAPNYETEITVEPGGKASVQIHDQEVGRLYHRLGDPNNGDNQVTLFLYRHAPPGVWTLELYGLDIVDGRFHAWVERDSACRHCQVRFLTNDSISSGTTGTICNGLRTIAVGAYDAHQAEHPLGKFSSSGPTRDGRQKPDIAAPGVRVLAARSRPNSMNTDFPLLTRMSGTSMAAPHVTGTIALIFEAAKRLLTIEEIRRILIATVDPPPKNMTQSERLRLGYGYLNSAAAVAAAEQLSMQESEPEQEGTQPPDDAEAVLISVQN